MGGEWRTTTLGDFVSFQRGHDLPSTERRSGSVPILGSFGITGWHDTAKAKGPGVTVGRSGASFGTTSFTDVDYWPLNTALYVRDFHGNDEKFTYYFLRSIDFTQFNTGSAQPSLNRNHIHPISVRVPCLNIQKAIAHILGTLDDKIELNRQTNETLEAMAQALFKSWFVDFDPVIDNALAAGNDIPEPFKARAAARQALGDARKPLPEEIRREFPDGFEFRDEMGWVPRGWEYCKLSDVLELLYGKSLPARDRLDGPYPVYGSGGISGYHSESIVEGPGIIVGRKGTVGSIYWVDEDFYPIDTVFYVKAFELVPLSFLYRSLLRIDIKSMGADSAVPGVNRNALYSAPIVRAPDNILAEFESRATVFWTRQTLHVRQSSRLSRLRDTLLPKLLSGQLTIPNAEKLVSNAT